MSASKLVISLFDVTGNIVEPWVEAGYQALLVDLTHPVGLHRGHGNRWLQGINLSFPYQLPSMFATAEIAFVAASPPCDHLACSGARWFKGKGLRALAHSISLFATAAEFCEMTGAPYLIENPQSTISTYWREPDYTFQPYQFTMFEPDDAYTKKTCLWTGHGFIMPPAALAPEMPVPESRMFGTTSADRSARRSATPLGFARAVFAANASPA